MTKKRRKKPVFLYAIIIVLSAALLALGGITFLSLNELSSIQVHVVELTAAVQSLSESTSDLIAKASSLEGTQNNVSSSTGEVAGPMMPAATTEETDTTTQEEGTLSPNTGNTFTDNSDAEMDHMLNQINDLLPQNNGSWSLYVCNLYTGTEGTISSKPMQAASLIKLFIMGAVYENYDSIIQQYGQENVDSLLRAMITVSDNDAANTLTSYLGGGDSSAGMTAVNNFCQAHGYSNTSMGRLLLQSNEHGDNYTSVADCGRFLKEVYDTNAGISMNPTLTHTDSMYELLKAQTRRNKIPASIPEGIGVANKTGELATVENDAGIIYNSAKGIDLVICFMSENLTAVGSAQQTIAECSRMIYGYYNE